MTLTFYSDTPLPPDTGVITFKWESLTEELIRRNLLDPDDRLPDPEVRDAMHTWLKKNEIKRIEDCASIWFYQIRVSKKNAAFVLLNFSNCIFQP